MEPWAVQHMSCIFVWISVTIIDLHLCSFFLVTSVGFIRWWSPLLCLRSWTPELLARTSVGTSWPAAVQNNHLHSNFFLSQLQTGCSFLLSFARISIKSNTCKLEQHPCKDVYQRQTSQKQSECQTGLGIMPNPAAQVNQMSFFPLLNLQKQYEFQTFFLCSVGLLNDSSKMVLDYDYILLLSPAIWVGKARADRGSWIGDFV